MVQISIELLELVPCVALLAVDGGQVDTALLQLFQRGVDVDDETFVAAAQRFFAFQIIGGGGYCGFEVV